MRFEEGLTLKEIGAHFDVAPKTAWAWAQEAKYGQEWRKHENERKRKWDRKNPGRDGCRTCGREPLHSSTYVKACAQCRAVALEKKYRYVERRWNEGVPVMYIAAEVGTTYKALHVLIVKLRKQPGFHLPLRKTFSEEGHRNLTAHERRGS